MNILPNRSSRQFKRLFTTDSTGAKLLEYAQRIQTQAIGESEKGAITMLRNGRGLDHLKAAGRLFLLSFKANEEGSLRKKRLP